MCSLLPFVLAVQQEASTIQGRFPSPNSGELAIPWQAPPLVRPFNKSCFKSRTAIVFRFVLPINKEVERGMVTNVLTRCSGGIAMRHSSAPLSVKRVHCDKTQQVLHGFLANLNSRSRSLSLWSSVRLSSVCR